MVQKTEQEVGQTKSGKVAHESINDVHHPSCYRLRWSNEIEMAIVGRGTIMMAFASLDINVTVLADLNDNFGLIGAQ